MAESSTIGASFSQYAGDPNLGGGSLGFGKIDSRPVEDFARYVMLYNKAEYDQGQKDKDEKVKELAQLSQINIYDLKPVDRDRLMPEWTNLLKYASDFARKTPTSNEEKLQQQLEWKLKMKAVMDKYEMGKRRAVGYESQKAAIEKKYGAGNSITDIELKKLDEELTKTDITTPISAMPMYDLKEVQIGDPVFKTFKGIQEGSNKDLNTEFSIFSAEGNVFGANDDAGSYAGSLIPEEDPRFSSLSQTEKEKQRLQNIKTKQSETWQSMSQQYNSALSDQDNFTEGVFDETKFEKKYAGTPIMRIHKAMKGLNEYADKKVLDIKQKKFSDKLTGYKVPENLTAEEYERMKINYSDGNVTGAELALAERFSRFQQMGGDRVIAKKLDQTDLAIKSFSEATERMNAITARAKSAQGEKDIKQGIELPGNLYEQHIRRIADRIKRVGGDKVVVSYDATDEATRKALGIESGSKSGYVTYFKDGSVKIETGEDGNGGTPITAEKFKKGYIDFVKSGFEKDGVQTEGFIESAEQHFRNKWGTTSASDIFNIVFSGNNEVSGGDKKDANVSDDDKLSDKEYYEKYKKFRTKNK